MDALKKAEEEKKRAAKQLKEVDELPDVDDSGSFSSNELADSTDEQPVLQQSAFSETSELTLEPLDSIFEDTAVLPVEDTQQISQKDIPTVDVTQSFSEDMTIENTVEKSIIDQSLEATQEAIDLDDNNVLEGLSTESSSAPFDDTFHGVIMDEADEDTDVYEETLPGVSADQLAKDIGGGNYQPTPVAAQTVFSASQKNTKTSKSSFKWGVLTVMIVLALGSFAVFYYFSITPVSRTMPSPTVARGIETTPVPPRALSIPEAEEEAVSGTLISSETAVNNDTDLPEVTQVDQTLEQVIDTEMSPELIAQAQAVAEQMTIKDEDMVEQEIQVDEIKDVLVDKIAGMDTAESIAEIVTDKRDAVEDIAAPVSDAPTNDGSTEALIAKAQVLEDAAGTSVNTPDASVIRISKNTKPEKKAVIIGQAFKAFKARQYDAARSLYNDALKLQPNSRDAHLGLAAIAIRDADKTAAYSHYAYLLKLNPKDPLAISALQSLYNDPDPVRDESAIKLLLQSEGDLPYLHFALGNIYAKQLRWSEAQQAFFDAYRVDNNNAEYAFNLAVSLDHMGKYKAARDFYQQALDLADPASTRFDYVAVNNRIAALSASTAIKP